MNENNEKISQIGKKKKKENCKKRPALLKEGLDGKLQNILWWSSAVEAIQSERALVLMQRVLEEKMMGYSVPRNQLNGSFTRDSVPESLKLIVVEEEGKIYRERIKEMKGLFVKKEKDDLLIDQFLEYHQTHRKAN